MILVYRNFGRLSGALLLSLLVFTPTLIMYKYFFAYRQDDAFDSVRRNVANLSNTAVSRMIMIIESLFHYPSGN